MKLNPSVFDAILQNFLDEWQPADVSNMTLQLYANLNDHNSFCYWLEYGSSELGAIGNNSLNKFSIWIPKEENKVFDKMFSYDGVYAWYTTLGATAEIAWRVVHAHIKEIVRLSLADDFSAIEQIKTHAIVKWKIAFLYSRKQLLPIYSRPALLQVAKGLGGHFNLGSAIFDIQSFILAFKPVAESMEDFAARIYNQYRLKDRRFYIFGSKYSDEKGADTKDVFPDMLAASDVAMGFMNGFNFTPYTGANSAAIEKLVTTNYKEKKPELPKMKRYFRLLIQIKEGDIIAVKSHGTHNQLTIIAYAMVVKRNGSVYNYVPGQLGHHIHVEFLDWGFKKKTGLTYAETIHEVKANNSHLGIIFGSYALFAKGSTRPEENDEDGDETTDRDENDYMRGETSQVVVRQIHNIMQNRFLKYLKNKHKGQTIEREYKNRIDVYREDGSAEWLYEIKPFESPYRCIREGIGQLLDYVHRFRSLEDLTVVIVGPEKPKDSDQRFIAHLQETLSVAFEYQAFDYLNNA
ncbi:MAG: hypothetical protein JWQ09_4779 [Segetibacter sp.]|nr:hypothetical protein [Segetibacter sp.]